MTFDKVWHTNLIYKLHQLQVPDRLVFTNIHFFFLYENSISAKRLNRGTVPQGSILSLLLYYTYTNDFPRLQTSVQLALFVNDSTLYLRGSNFTQITPPLQKAIDKLTRWIQIWKIELPTRCASRAPVTPLENSARAESLRDFLCQSCSYGNHALTASYADRPR
ncbi:RNA-directed DNA polymerase from mobile element jockey [Eumeta japonica]|uniref:RNA-directed DNA polymerase from mobile element jockey n=1 Tax=Eumeta variegata TaxID=151549 RepID=A0A4C1TPG0_EUMVA|nr:RNA-directed DNA polymerase from mobile element jockey [Eumeta japonica]